MCPLVCRAPHPRSSNRSSPVDDPVASYAVGVVRGNELLLVPLDYTLQVCALCVWHSRSARCCGTV
jgi:hypothetical protein